VEREQEIRELRDRIAAIRAELGDRSGELAHIDQHPGEGGTDLQMREQDEGRLIDLESRLARLEGRPVPGEAAGPAPGTDDGDDVSTPLDDPAPPERLDAIPLGSPDPLEYLGDPDRDDQEPEMDAPGEAYAGEGGAPRVGRAEPADAALRRAYRPEDEPA
jgi:hypothetical protein